MNWSLILNAILLVAVVYVLVRMLRKKDLSAERVKVEAPALEQPHVTCDDIIAVRQVEQTQPATSVLIDTKTLDISAAPTKSPQPMAEPTPSTGKTLLLFLLAKPQRQLAGYDLLQALLSAGLRFGEGQLFHRHQFTNGQGPVLCSLAAATPSGTFDLQNIGAFNTKGLCLYMYLSGHQEIDTERLEKLLETAEHLSEGLDTLILDHRRQPFTPQTKTQYQQLLQTAS